MQKVEKNLITHSILNGLYTRFVLVYVRVCVFICAFVCMLVCKGNVEEELGGDVAFMGLYIDK